MKARLTFLALLILTQATYARELCFKANPTGKFDDTKCSPVAVDYKIVDCSSGAVKEEFKGVARYSCSAEKPNLKYWHKDAMLVSELGKKNHELEKNYALDYTDKKNPKNITPTHVVLLPSKKETSGGGAVMVAPLPSVSADVHALDLAAEKAIEEKATTDAELKAKEDLAKSVAQEKEAAEKALAEKMATEENKKVALATPITTGKTESAGAFFSQITVSGMADVGYTYNSNLPAPVTAPTAVTAYEARPATQNKGQVFSATYHDQVTLNMAKLVFNKEAKPVGFRADLGFGPEVDAISATGTDQSNRNLLQGYLTFKLSDSITLETGKFYTSFGYEVPEATDNSNYSRSLATAYVMPTWFSGARMMYSTDTFKMGAYVVNGWNILYENNKNKTLAATFTIAPNKIWSLTGNHVYGSELASGNDIRTATEGILTLNPVDSLKLVATFDLANEKIGDTTKNISSSAFYMELSLGKKWMFAPRYENLMDSDTASFGTGFAGGQTITATTYTLVFLPTEQSKVFVEYRQDMSNKNYYSDPNGAAINTQSLTSLGAALNF